ncbi:Tyrosine-protein kinase CSK [Rhizoctonia solani]|uniref:Tyrosine-protein kinase CSK n=1 Tax=Rhizoctonia solani TaxID=456999 RepID=A0A0K6G5D7_9AGAM|nr:Tyrosine-protein kinase CSK [Rhizoctonia solani]
MIHGDLKATNILVSQDLSIKISDFDCSIVSDCSLVFSATGQAISLRWAAPELMGSSEDETNVEKTRQSDVYALGMTLLEIVTGEAPYSEYRFDVGVMKAVVIGKLPKRPAALREGNRKDAFWNLLEQCWNPDQTARPSAQRVLTRLQFETDPPEFKELGLAPKYMSLQDMFEWLLYCGRVDLSSKMDPGQDTAVIASIGSFGDIWRGELYDGTKVAIKAIRPSTFERIDYEKMKRAAREIYLWSRLAHPNIHQLMGIIVFKDHQLGMVSQWMENGNLSECMRKAPDFDRHQTCIQITSAIACMHHQGVVHGDVRSSNVLVSQEGAAKLASFKLANVTPNVIDSSPEYRPWRTSVRWEAPELILERGTKSESTDVYALGMTILEILTGKVPYPECRRDFHVVMRVQKGILPTRPMDSLGNDERSNRMWELMVSCWNRDPAARPTAAEVLESLNTISSLHA